MARRNNITMEARGHRSAKDNKAFKAYEKAQADNIQIYDNDIELYADEYIRNKLKDPEEMNGNTFKFSAMMGYIYRHVFRPHETMQYNSNTLIDTGNIKLLDHIWDIYTDLCYQYNVMPTIYRYCKLTGISDTAVNGWQSGNIRNSNPAYIAMTKKWRAECESALVDATGNNTVKSIFLLKSKYGYTETPQQITLTNANAPALTTEQIEEIAEQTAADAPAIPGETITDEK